MLVAGVVNAQEFYTCVPKKNWWKDTIKEGVPSANDIANAVKGAIPQQPSSGWKLVKRLEFKNQYLENMEFGKYKVGFCGKESKSFSILSGERIKIEVETNVFDHKIKIEAGEFSNYLYHRRSREYPCDNPILNLYKYE